MLYTPLEFKKEDYPIIILKGDGLVIKAFESSKGQALKYKYITKIGYVFPDRKHRWYQTTFSRLLSALLNKNELVRLSIIDVNKIPWEFAIPSVDEELTAIIKFIREKIKD